MSSDEMPVMLAVVPRLWSLQYAVCLGCGALGICFCLMTMGYYALKWNSHPIRHHDRGVFMIMNASYVVLAVIFILYGIARITNVEMDRIIMSPLCSLQAGVGFMSLMYCLSILIQVFRYYFRMNLALLVNTPKANRGDFFRRRKMFTMMTKTPARTRFFGSWRFVAAAYGVFLIYGLAFNMHVFYTQSSFEASVQLTCVASSSGVISSVVAIFAMSGIAIAIIRR